MTNDMQLSPIYAIFVAIGIIAIMFIVILLLFTTYDFLKNKIYKNIYKKRREIINLKSEVTDLKIENEELITKLKKHEEEK